jgi:hypothetical protein
MCSSLDDAAPCHDQDLIGAQDRGKSVRDH